MHMYVISEAMKHYRLARWLNISTDNRTWIQQYVDRKYLLDGFSNYFGLHNEGIGVPFEVKNLKSALESPLAVQDKINK